MRGRAISLICQYSYFIPALRLPCLFANAFCHLCLFILVSYLYCLIVNDISFIFCVLKFYYFLILFLMIILSILPCCLVPFPFMPAASSPSLLPCRWTGRSPAFHLLLICHVATFLSPAFLPFPLSSLAPAKAEGGFFFAVFLRCGSRPVSFCHARCSLAWLPALLSHSYIPISFATVIFLLFFAESCCPCPLTARRGPGDFGSPCPTFSAFHTSYHTSCPVCGDLPSLPPLSYFSIFLCGLAVSDLCDTILARFPCCRAALWQQGFSAFCLSVLPSGRLTAPCRPSPFPL